jgi:hypothetical protein
MKEYFAKVMVFSLLICLVSSCADDDYVADASGDVFIVSRVRGEEAITVYGLALHAFGNKDFSKVTVASPASVSTELAPYMGSAYEYYSETEKDEYTAILPALGNYNFSFNFKTAEVDTDVDELTDDVLVPATITRCEYDAADSRIEIEWDAIDNADYIVICLEDQDGDPVYISTALSGSSTGHQIASGTSHWYIAAPGNGDVYTVIVGAFMYETTAADMNIQAKSIATATAVWGGTN